MRSSARKKESISRVVALLAPEDHECDETSDVDCLAIIQFKEGEDDPKFKAYISRHGDLIAVRYLDINKVDRLSRIDFECAIAGDHGYAANTVRAWLFPDAAE